MELLKGITLLLAALTAFSLFSRYAPKGTLAREVLRLPL